jgi:serine protease AprX
MNDRNYTGRGITAAVLDTGIYPHIDFGNRILAFRDFVSARGEPYDDNGHGTHVSGILGGDGTASQGRYVGAAPGCALVSLKVLDRRGNGNKEDLLRAFTWILRYHREYQIRIVNISVGTTYKTNADHTRLIRGVEELWDQGLVVVAAAGNEGPGFGSVTAPGCSRKIITVGSSDLLEGKKGISGRGPTNDCVCKPDLVAPGVRIVSCIPGNGRQYAAKSGTSMSTPQVSGAIACMLEKDPRLTNVEIKMLLRESAQDLGFPQNIQGWGKFDPEKFLQL